MPFLEHVVQGKRVPRERLVDVAEHYEWFGGVSPINAQNRALLAALLAHLNEHGPQLPVYWGNRHWHPFLADTLQEMADDGVRRALCFVTSAFSSYSGCRQYLEDIQQAREAVGASAPEVDKIRLFYNHPGFIQAIADRVGAALAQVPEDRRPAAEVIYTAHSLPLSMARGCRYEEQLAEACRLVSEQAGIGQAGLVYQSRSGPPSEPWLGPDVLDRLAELGQAGQARDVVLVPIGFLSEHMEVVYDLDVEAAAVCEHFGMNLVRAGVAGTHSRLVQMIRELILERIDPATPRLAIGSFGPEPDVCPADCCPSGRG